MTYHPDPTQELLSALPSWRSVLMLRTIYLRRRLAGCGTDFVLAQGAILRYPESITLGDRVFINRQTTITARAPITIGNDVLIGPQTIIDSGNHRHSDLEIPINRQGYERAPITIGSNVWIGAHVTILAGVSIGHGSIVAAGSVVTHTVPPMVIFAGVPARFHSQRRPSPVDNQGLRS